MRILFLTFLLTLSFTVTKADVGEPTIQAICKVTMNDGKTIEGIIVFARGGYVTKYRSNGFCLKPENGKRELILFDFQMKHFIPENYKRHQPGTSTLYYAANVTKMNDRNSSVNFNEKEQILTRTISTKEEFKLADEMVLYKNLPLTLYVDLDQHLEKIGIKVSEIMKLELIENPNQTWLDMISGAREKLNKQVTSDIEKNDSAWDDYAEPVWYHEVISDEQKLNSLLRLF